MSKEERVSDEEESASLSGCDLAPAVASRATPRFTQECHAGGWKRLCCAMLVQTASTLSRQGKRDSCGNPWNVAEERKEAILWLEGGVGTVTFEDVCETLDLDPDWARDKMWQAIRGGSVESFRMHR